MDYVLGNARWIMCWATPDESYGATPDGLYIGQHQMNNVGQHPTPSIKIIRIFVSFIIKQNNPTMPQSLSKVYVHIVFSTKHRQNFIDKNIEESLFAYLGQTCKNKKCNPIQVGGYQNHVHILCTLSRTITQAKLLEELKKQSSKWMKLQGDAYRNFYWQDGYGIFSVNHRKIETVKIYIINQREHHENRDFKTEFRSFLEHYEIEYDERYVWD
jgi:putative transposase